MFEDFRAGQVGKKVGWCVVVDLVVIVAVEKIAKILDAFAEVVTTREGGQFLKLVGMTKCDVGGVESSEAATMRNDPLV